MKKTFSIILAVTAGLFILPSCEKEDSKDANENDQAFEAIAETFLSNTVFPTYAALADNTAQLVTALETCQSSLTDANVKKACDIFLTSRAEWELSEAFLFGAATDFGIDPHIDSWPLDVDNFNNWMTPENIAKLDVEDADIFAGDNLGNALLGFHGIEYVLFDNGSAKPASAITKENLIYCVAVAGDLRNRTAQLDVAWRGQAAPSARIEMVEDDLEFNTTVGGGDYYYGENLLNAGKPGSTFYSWTHAMQSILQSAADIADEVGTSKIGKAHNGEDITYIESPYSENSIADFYDNITSVANVYYGGRVGNRVPGKSLSEWFSVNEPETNKLIETAISDALAKVQAMKAPFVKNYTDASCTAAMEACANLVEALEGAIVVIANN